jgi:DNA-binding MarR family transcriptional regulator
MANRVLRQPKKPNQGMVKTGLKELTPCPPELLEYFGYCLKRVYLTLQSTLEEHFNALKISVQQFGLLAVLDRTGSLSQVGLGVALGIDKASMVKLLDDLEAKGYVKREAVPGDRRVKRLVLTNQGAKILGELKKIRTGIEKQFLAPLSKKEKEFLHVTLRKLIEPS